MITSLRYRSTLREYGTLGMGDTLHISACERGIGSSPPKLRTISTLHDDDAQHHHRATAQTCSALGHVVHLLLEALPCQQKSIYKSLTLNNSKLYSNQKLCVFKSHASAMSAKYMINELHLCGSKTTDYAAALLVVHSHIPNLKYKRTCAVIRSSMQLPCH